MKVLVVDDDPSISNLCERLIRRAGHMVSTAASAPEAINRLGEGWDVVLTDLSLGGEVDGLQLLTHVRSHGHADAIIMTAFPEVQTVIKALREGAYDYLTKPFNEESLIKTLDRCAEKRRLSVELAREKALRSELEKAYHELTRLKKVNETFGHFLSPEVVQFILAHPKEFWKKGQRRDATLIFADVRRFTPFASSVPPEEALAALNQIFSRMIEAVNEEGGTVNKFLGDGLLAIFGTPVPNEEHALCAARAALRARDAVETLAKEREAQGLTALHIGLGVNTGAVVAGYLGTEHRAEYSVIGHAVNLAARLEERAKPGEILVGPETAWLLKGQFNLRDMPPVTLAGVSEPLAVAELLGQKPSGAARTASVPRLDRP